MRELIASLFSGKRHLTPLAYAPEIDVSATFWSEVAARRPMRVLEAGTLRSVAGRSTHHKGLFGEIADENYIRIDVADGADVDVLADLHRLPADWSESFDCFIAQAVFEHLERPWIAAQEVARVLRPGGIFMVGTHQCFPLHGYPRDFFRFSREALRLIFEDAGLVVSAADYRHRCAIIPPDDVVHQARLRDWNEAFASFILVEATGCKPASD